MKCEEARELITALVDEELFHQERTAIEAHLRDCPKCRWAYEQELALKREIHKVGARTSVPADLKRKIIAGYGISATELESSDWCNKVVISFRSLFRSAVGLSLLLIVLSLICLMRPHGQLISLMALEIE